MTTGGPEFAFRGRKSREGFLVKLFAFVWRAPQFMFLALNRHRQIPRPIAAVAVVSLRELDCELWIAIERIPSVCVSLAAMGFCNFANLQFCAV